MRSSPIVHPRVGHFTHRDKRGRALRALQSAVRRTAAELRQIGPSPSPRGHAHIDTHTHTHTNTHTYVGRRTCTPRRSCKAAVHQAERFGQRARSWARRCCRSGWSGASKQPRLMRSTAFPNGAWCAVKLYHCQNAKASGIKPPKPRPETAPSVARKSNNSLKKRSHFQVRKTDLWNVPDLGNLIIL